MFCINIINIYPGSYAPFIYDLDESMKGSIPEWMPDLFTLSFRLNPVLEIGIKFFNF